MNLDVTENNVYHLHKFIEYYSLSLALHYDSVE